MHEILGRCTIAAAQYCLPVSAQIVNTLGAADKRPRNEKTNCRKRDKNEEAHGASAKGAHKHLQREIASEQAQKAHHHRNNKARTKNHRFSYLSKTGVCLTTMQA